MLLLSLSLSLSPTISLFIYRTGFMLTAMRSSVCTTLDWSSSKMRLALLFTSIISPLAFLCTPHVSAYKHFTCHILYMASQTFIHIHVYNVYYTVVPVHVHVQMRGPLQHIFTVLCYKCNFLSLNVCFYIGLGIVFPRYVLFLIRLNCIH